MSRPSSSEPRPTTGRLAMFTLAILSAAPAHAGGVEAPVGGWRHGAADATYTQEVNYPAVRPSASGNTPDSARIRGRIASLGKQATPATLVVNGTAMPLQSDNSGAFDRAYTFPDGSNSLEIRAPNGKPLHRMQFYETNPNRAQARLRVVLSWDTPGTDLDLHVVTPSGEHAWYGERAISSGALDVDVTTGYGPEIFSAPAPQKGNYQVYVNYYGGMGGFGEPEDEGNGETAAEPARQFTTAQVALVFNEGTPSERRQEFRVPMRKPGELTLVRQFVYP